MIYGQMGVPLASIRRANWEDVERLTEAKGGKPDMQDREAFDNDSYVVVTFNIEDSGERLYHLAFLRADGGIHEIYETLGAKS